MRSLDFLKLDTELLNGNIAVPFGGVVDIVRRATDGFRVKGLRGQGLPIFAPLSKTGLMGPQSQVTDAYCYWTILWARCNRG